MLWQNTKVSEDHAASYQNTARLHIPEDLDLKIGGHYTPYIDLHDQSCY
jgi:hypothetical protein